MKPFGGPYSSRVSQCFTFHIMSPCFHLSFTTCLPPPYLQLQPSCTSHVSGHSSLQPTGGWLMNLWPARLEWLEPNIAKWTSTKTGHGTIYILFQSIPIGKRVSIQNKTEHVEALKGTPSFFQPGFQSHSQNQNLLFFFHLGFATAAIHFRPNSCRTFCFHQVVYWFSMPEYVWIGAKPPWTIWHRPRLKRDVSLQANHLWNKMLAKTLGYSELLLRPNSETLSQWQ